MGGQKGWRGLQKEREKIMIEKVFAAIVLLFSIAMVIACGYFGGKSIEEKDFRTAGGLLSCEMIFLIVIMGMFL